MVNDTTTLNGALAELGETMAANITTKGVSASASDGLTTLAGKILQISGGGGGGTTLFEDACNSSSGLSDYGTSECIRGSNATITMSYDSTENAYKLSGSGNYHAYVPIPTLKDKDNYSIEADFKCQNIQYNGAGFYLDNYADNTSYGEAVYIQVPWNEVAIAQYKLSADGPRNPLSNAGVSANTWYKLKMTVEDSDIGITLKDMQGNIKGTSSVTLSVSNKSMGLFLCCEKGTTQSVCYVRNIKAESLGGGSDCSQYQQQIEDAIEYINGSGT